MNVQPASMTLEILSWGAWSPDRPDQDAWSDRSTIRKTSHFSEPACSFVPTMLRRRLSRLSRMALEVCHQALGNPRHEVHYAVFCSRHGEIHRTLTLLSSLAGKEDLSPAFFAQSVHNTASGMFGICFQSTIPTTTIAATRHIAEAGWTECFAFLKKNPDRRVLLVVFDETIPPVFEGFVRDSTDLAFALVLQMPRPDTPGPGLSLTPMMTAMDSVNPIVASDLPLIHHLTTPGPEKWAATGSNLLWSHDRNHHLHA